MTDAKQNGPCGRGCWYDNGIEKRVLLPISTGHLRRDTLDQVEFNPAANAPALSAQYEYGFFLYVPDDDDPESRFDDLQACVKFAREHNASYIQFDCDGPLYDELPQYDHDDPGRGAIDHTTGQPA